MDSANIVRLKTLSKHTDVFLCYADGDESTVDQIATWLKIKGVFFFFAKWHLIPGEFKPEVIRECLNSCRVCVIFIGMDSPPWHHKDVKTVLEKRSGNPNFHTLTVFLPGANQSQMLPNFCDFDASIRFGNNFKDEILMEKLFSLIDEVLSKQRIQWLDQLEQEFAQRNSSNKTNSPSNVDATISLRDGPRRDGQTMDTFVSGKSDLSRALTTLPHQPLFRRYIFHLATLMSVVMAIAIVFVIDTLKPDPFLGPSLATPTLAMPTTPSNTEIPATPTLTNPPVATATGIPVTIAPTTPTLTPGAPAQPQDPNLIDLILNAIRNRTVEPQTSILLLIESIKMLKQEQGSLPIESDRIIAVGWELQNALVSMGKISQPLPKHQSKVTSLAFSPTGRRLATGDQNGKLVLWNANNSEASVKEWNQHTDSITKIIFNPVNERQMLTVSQDQTIRVWDTEIPAESPVLLDLGIVVEATEISSRGHWLVVSGRSNTISTTLQLWDMQHLDKPVAKFDRNQDNIQVVAFSPNERWLATGGSAGTVQLWYLSELVKEPQILAKHEDSVVSIGFSPNGHWLATGSQDGAVYLWNMDEVDKNERIDPTCEGGVVKFVFSSDNKWLAVGCQDRSVRLWDLTRTPISLSEIGFLEFDAKIADIAFSPDTKWLAVSGDSKSVYLWKLAHTSIGPLKLEGHAEDGILALSFSPDGKWLATGGTDTTVRLWNMSDIDTELLIEYEHSNSMYSIAFSPQEHWLATGGQNGMIWLNDVTNANSIPITKTSEYTGVIQNLLFSHNGDWLITYSENSLNEKRESHIEFWEPGENSIERDFEIPYKVLIQTIAYDPTGKWLAAGGEDGSIYLHDMEKSTDPNPIAVTGHKAAITAAVFSADGHWLVTGDQAGVVFQWNVQAFSSTLSENGQPSTPAPTSTQSLPTALLGHQGAIQAIAFHPNGEWIATASADKTVRIWRTSSQEGNLPPLEGHKSVVTTVAFSPDGLWLATGSVDKTARLWAMNAITSTNSSKITPIILEFKDSVNALAFSTDSRWLAITSADKKTRLWRIAIDDLIEIACKSVGRNLSKAEWRDYFPDQEYRVTCSDVPIPD